MRYIRIAVCVVFALSVAFFGYVKYDGSKQIDNTLPQITGPAEMLEISCNYTAEDLLQGLYAYDEKDGDLTDEIMVDNMVPTLEKGKCTVNYVVFDSSNHPATFTRDVVFTDYRSPRVFVSRPMVFQKGANENVFGYIGATDVIDGDIGSLLRMNTNINMLEAGDYMLNVEASNSLGDHIKVELPVHIVESVDLRLQIKLSECTVFLNVNDDFNPEEYIESVVNADGTSYPVDAVDIQSSVNTAEPGVYEVIYTAQASNTIKGYTALLVIVE